MKFDTSFFLEVLKGSGAAIPLTIRVSLFAFFFGLIIGTVTALIFYYDIPVLRRLAQFYVSFVRGTPALLQLYIVYYLIPMSVDALLQQTDSDFRTNQISTVTLVIVAFSINCGAYISEIIRGGLKSIGRGEIEAALSVGMTGGRVVRRIILPQVLSISLPNLSQNLIAVIHGTSLAYFVSLLEITGTARIMASNGWKYFEAFLATGILYWLITIFVELVAFVIEKIAARKGYGRLQNT